MDEHNYLYIIKHSYLKERKERQLDEEEEEGVKRSAEIGEDNVQLCDDGNTED